ncbi:MAG: SRPBCC family protein [Trueperaceae bacterium]
MDRSDKFGSLHDTGRTGATGVDYYRQDFSDRDHEGMNAREWGFIAAGALLLGLGGYMLVQGSRGRAPELPFTGGRGEQGKSAASSRGRERGARATTKGETPGVQVREQVTINRSVSDLYRFWRNVENLPRVMGYLEDVNKSSDRRSHWVAKGPAGQRVEWDAEITDARENELVAWRSLEGSEVPNEGSVRFSRSPDGSGTVVDVALTYHPPGGKAGAAVAKLFGREPAQEIRRDLERFKQRVESGNLILATGAYGGTGS